jgi:CBS domain-containing protein
MPVDDDELERAQEEELPGPPNLEAVLFTETLSSAATRPPLILEADTTLAQVLRQMRENRYGCALLVRQGKLAGVFTERDVLLKIAGQTIDLERTPVSAYMTASPVTLPGDARVAFALNKMVIEGFRHIPLVDSEGRPTGVVSMREIIEYLSDFFRKDVLTLPPDPRVVSRSREGA